MPIPMYKLSAKIIHAYYDSHSHGLPQSHHISKITLTRMYVYLAIIAMYARREQYLPLYESIFHTSLFATTHKDIMMCNV